MGQRQGLGQRQGQRHGCSASRCCTSPPLTAWFLTTALLSPALLPGLLQIQESAASSVAMFAGLLSHEHRREHLTAVVDALMQNYEGGLRSV